MNDDRRLDTADTLSEVFSIYGSQAAVLLPVAFGLFVLVAVISGLLSGSILGALVAFAVSIVVTTLYQGMVVQLVRDVQDGRRDSSVGDLLRSAAPVVVPLIAAGLLAGLGIMIGFILLVVPGLILLTIWAVIAPVIVVERTGVLEAFGRSRELVRGNGWRVFGVIVAVLLISIVVGIVLGAIGAGVADDSDVTRIVSDLIGSTITAPISALVASVLYFRLRAIKETDTVADTGDVASGPSAGPGPATA
jgi:hypothetical protein